MLELVFALVVFKLDKLKLRIKNYCNSVVGNKQVNNKLLLVR
jgi:hypothetical protein